MTFLKMTGLKTSVFTLTAGALVLSAAMVVLAFSQAQAAPEMKVAMAMAMPMHAGKTVRHGKRHMAHHMAAKDGNRYGMK